jgi:hypothetical protein
LLSSEKRVYDGADSVENHFVVDFADVGHERYVSPTVWCAGIAAAFRYHREVCSYSFLWSVRGDKYMIAQIEQVIVECIKFKHFRIDLVWTGRLVIADT